MTESPRRSVILVDEFCYVGVSRTGDLAPLSAILDIVPTHATYRFPPREPMPAPYDPASKHTRLAHADHFTSERPLTKRQRRRKRNRP